jgi:hypothetical protein
MRLKTVIDYRMFFYSKQRSLDPCRKLCNHFSFPNLKSCTKNKPTTAQDSQHLQKTMKF